MHVGVIPGDPVGDVLQDRGLPGLGRGDDERALPEPKRVHEVDEALAQVGVFDLEVEHLVREDGNEVFEDRTTLGELGVDAVDRLDAEQAEILLAVLRGPRLTGDEVAGTQSEAPHLARADVNVLGRGQQSAAAEEPEAVLDDLEDALREDVPLRLGLRLQDAGDEVLLRERGRFFDVELASDLSELPGLLLVELGDRVVLAAGLRHRGLATGDRGGATVAVGRSVGGGGRGDRSGRGGFSGVLRGGLWVFQEVYRSLLAVRRWGSSAG